MGTPWVSFNGKDCSGCKHLSERGYCEFTACIIPCSVRATIPEVKPKTNGDNFRAMTDEELAEWFVIIAERQLNHVRMRLPTEEEKVEARKAWLEWLKRECEP